MIELVFFSCLAICAYVYFGYPLLLAVIAALRRRDVGKNAVTPSVSVIIAAHNEERVMAGKLENTLSLDYPKDRFEIIVGSDGSNDRTNEIIGAYETKGVRALLLPRCGKLHALNAAVAVATHEIVVFTDANALLERSALRALAANFSDPEVGGVCGNQKYRRTQNGDCAGEGENLYWRYDKLIKRLECRIGSIVAADGSLYAIRKRLFAPIADPAQADDFAISARVVTQGSRLVFETGAVSYEDPPNSSEREFWRKVRVNNHGMRSIVNLKEALKPWRTGIYAIELWSHKVLRYLAPLFLLIAFGANAVLAQGSRFFQLLLLGQLLFYGGAAMGYKLRHQRWGRIRLFYVPFYFCLGNAAALVGMASLLRGERIISWQPHREFDHAREVETRYEV
ncbi:MAG: glycosyltransferase family 2 protein [Acidobacteria bacterium]|nr:glycosyltransferase family 2 protein [Acidobacteriota bacterium]